MIHLRRSTSNIVAHDTFKKKYFEYCSTGTYIDTFKKKKYFEYCSTGYIKKKYFEYCST